MATITPKKGLGKKKTGETYRLQIFMANAGLGPDELAEKTEVSAKTITHCLYESKPIGAKLLRQIHLIYGVSMDWLISDVGECYLPGREPSGAAVVSEPAAGYDADQLPAKLSRWLASASPTERAWMDVEIRHRIFLAQHLNDG